MIGYLLDQSTDGQWYVTLVSLGNHAKLMTSEMYQDERDAQALVEILRKGGLDLVDAKVDPTRAPKTEWAEGPDF